MAETTTATPAKATTTRSRARKTAPAATKSTTARKAAPKTESTDAIAVKTEGDVTVMLVDFLPHPDGNTKSYTRWVAPEGHGFTGTLYAPLGVTEVKVKLSGPTAEMTA